MHTLLLKVVCVVIGNIGVRQLKIIEVLQEEKKPDDIENILGADIEYSIHRRLRATHHVAGLSIRGGRKERPRMPGACMQPHEDARGDSKRGQVLRLGPADRGILRKKSGPVKYHIPRSTPKNTQALRDSAMVPVLEFIWGG